MSSFIYILISAVAFVVVLGVLVMIHEVGHFLTARLFGVRVEEFGIGFPPRIYPAAEVVKRRREAGKTVYSLNALPLGGFVRLAGENGVAAIESSGEPGGQSGQGRQPNGSSSFALSGQVGSADDPGAFGNKPPWQRIVVLGAGCFNNMVLAMVLFFLTLAVIGTPRPSGIEVVGVEAHSPAQQAGLRPGDFIQRIDGQTPRDTQSVHDLIAARVGRQVTVSAMRGGRTYAVTLVPRDLSRLDPRVTCDKGAVGVMTTQVGDRNTPLPVGTAAGAALRLPVTIIQSLAALPQALGASPQQPTAPTTIAVPSCPNRTVYVTFAGRRVDAETLLRARIPGAEHLTGDPCAAVTGGGAGIAGPIGIVRIVGCEANAIPTQGWLPLLSLVVGLSATLAVLNLLPIPALDGGRILFVLISLVSRRRVNPQVEALAHALGMAALLALIVAISVHDLSTWLGQSALH